MPTTVPHSLLSRGFDLVEASVVLARFDPAPLSVGGTVSTPEAAWTVALAGLMGRVLRDETGAKVARATPGGLLGSGFKVDYAGGSVRLRPTGMFGRTFAIETEDRQQVGQLSPVAMFSRALVVEWPGAPTELLAFAAVLVMLAQRRRSSDDGGAA